MPTVDYNLLIAYASLCQMYYSTDLVDDSSDDRYVGKSGWASCKDAKTGFTRAVVINDGQILIPVPDNLNLSVLQKTTFPETKPLKNEVSEIALLDLGYLWELDPRTPSTVYSLDEDEDSDDDSAEYSDIIE